MAFLWFDCYWSLIIYIFLGTESILYKKQKSKLVSAYFFANIKAVFT